jgi:hypothetical protein
VTNTGIVRGHLLRPEVSLLHDQSAARFLVKVVEEDKLNNKEAG